MDIIKEIRTARRVDTPVLAVRTADQWALIAAFVKSGNGNGPAVLTWDLVDGLTATNAKGEEALVALGDTMGSQDPVACLTMVRGNLPGGTVLFLRNAHRVLGDPAVATAIAKIRDTWRGADGEKRTLILLGPSFEMPEELQADVWLLREELPGRAALADILAHTYQDGLPPLSEDAANRAVDAVAGLPAFPAEQAIAMSLTPAGLDMDALWERKREMISETPGLTLHTSGPHLDDLGGLASIKEYVSLLVGNNRFGAVAWVDEVEKGLAGATAGGGDTSGVSQDALGVLLQWTANRMQDAKVVCVLLAGVPGSGKSALAQAAGRAAGVPTIRMDLGAMKGSLVGQSEQRIRTALETVDAVAGEGTILVLATCNNVSVLPPEFLSRFAGVWFFDLPTADEQASIWPIHRAKCGIADGDQAPAGEYTGREIMQVCQQARLLGIPLHQAARYVVQAARSQRTKIDAWRAEADGRFLAASGSEDGVYRRREAAATAPQAVSAGRKIELE